MSAAALSLVRSGVIEVVVADCLALLAVLQSILVQLLLAS